MSDSTTIINHHNLELRRRSVEFLERYANLFYVKMLKSLSWILAICFEHGQWPYGIHQLHHLWSGGKVPFFFYSNPE